MKNILVLGADGFLGRAFYQYFYPTALGTSRRNTSGMVYLDIKNPDLSFLSEHADRFSHAIICIAKSNIAFCESSPKESSEINVSVQLDLAKSLLEHNIFPVLFSSDYVFDGTRGSYNEEDSTNPLNEYGRQKLELEQGLEKRFHGQYLLIRSSKVFGLNKGDNTLLDQMASSLVNRREIYPACDQIFSPIFLDDLVFGVFKLIQQHRSGLYNVCSPEVANRYEIALKLCKSLDCDLSLIKKISLDDLGESFKRPKNTSMRCDRFLLDANLSTKTVDECISKVASNYYDRCEN